MVAAEGSEAARQWVSPATEERHGRALADPTMLQLIVEEDGRPVGHVLLTGLERAAMGIEFRRYVVWEPGRGIGSAALPLKLMAITAAEWRSRSAPPRP